MAPRVPDEIDVFTAPHSRMKQLVNIYTQKMQCVDFRDGPEVISLLQDLNTTLHEFKSHESIENIFIMDQLKNRLKQRQIINTAVCDCHNDNRLADVVQLVRTGTKVRERSIGERVSFGRKLQHAFEDFVQNFLPHMEEEEQVFQPLLVEYFDYDELKILKEVVLKEHELIKERQCLEKAHDEEPETSGEVKDLRDLDWDLCSFTEPFDNEEHRWGKAVTVEDQSWTDHQDGHSHACTESSFEVCSCDTTLTQRLEMPSPQTPGNVPVPALPTEILVEIFRYLTPPDLGQCAQVCSTWNNAVFSPSLWTAIYPVQWARGIWKAEDVRLCDALEDAALCSQAHGLSKWDEDADVDEAEEERDPLADNEYFVLESLVNWVLPRVGTGVNTLVVDAGQGITSRLLHHALLLCPNLTKLSAAHTQIDHYSFKGLWLQGSLQKLQHLDLQGCTMIDDLALEYLAECARLGQCSMGNTSNFPPLDVNHYIEAPEIMTYHSSECAREEQVWTGADERENLQVSGYCKCWCGHMQGMPLTANLQSWQNSYSLHNPCQNVKKYDYLSGVKGKNSKCLAEDYSQRGGYSSPSQRTLLPSSPSRQTEQDIEEICCYSRSFTSWEIVPGSYSCRNLAYQPSKPSHDRKPSPSNCVHNLQLVTLSLSGCWRITDEGLLAMVDAGILDNLRSIDVSGCYQLTGEGLDIFTHACPSLQPENLWYCDNIDDGPYPTQANGCANLCNPVRVCCRSGR